MAQYNLSHTGQQLDAAVEKYLQVDFNSFVDSATLNNYVTTTALNTTLENYLSVNDAASTYLTNSNAANTYLSITNAENTYLKIADQLNSNITTINATITLSTSWQNTGIVSSSLSSGVYIVILDGLNSGYAGQWSETYAGLIVWYSGSTNSSDAEEIPLVNAGHARNGVLVYLRLARSSNSDGKAYLQIRGSSAASTSATLRFRFKRLV